jgi:hypothetical protein
MVRKDGHPEGIPEGPAQLWSCNYSLKMLLRQLSEKHDHLWGKHRSSEYDDHNNNKKAPICF